MKTLYICEDDIYSCLHLTKILINELKQNNIQLVKCGSTNLSKYFFATNNKYLLTKNISERMSMILCLKCKIFTSVFNCIFYVDLAILYTNSMKQHKSFSHLRKNAKRFKTRLKNLNTYL